MSASEHDDALRERLAEVRGEHGWARHVEDEVLVAWLRPAPRRDGQEPDVTR